MRYRTLSKKRKEIEKMILGQTCMFLGWTPRPHGYCTGLNPPVFQEIVGAVHNLKNACNLWLQFWICGTRPSSSDTGLARRHAWACSPNHKY